MTKIHLVKGLRVFKLGIREYICAKTQQCPEEGRKVKSYESKKDVLENDQSYIPSPRTGPGWYRADARRLSGGLDA